MVTTFPISEALRKSIEEIFPNSDAGLLALGVIGFPASARNQSADPVMVRDDRASRTGGWALGTFCYNGSFKATNKWKRLFPVRIQWGNDSQFDDWQAIQKHSGLLPKKTQKS